MGDLMKPQSRHIIVLLCGTAVSALAALMPSSATAFEDDGCLEPWSEGCVSSTSGCTDCATYCASHAPVGQCEVEWAYCQDDREICTGSNHIESECACKAKSDWLPCGPAGCE
jgi:hypothetical protein